MKTCKKCGGTEFRQSSGKCIPCEKKYNSEYVRNPMTKERRNELQRKRYANVFSKSQYDAEYRAKNKDKLIAKVKAKYAKNRHSKKNILIAAKARAKKQHVPFDICEDDFIIPDVCPVLGIPIKQADGRANENSPSLDKIIPSLGYVKGNVAIISQRANWIKRDASVEEIEMLLNWLKSHFQDPNWRKP